jgi:hypothetical protein
MPALPPEHTPLYNHTLPALEAWLREIGAEQDMDRPESWRLSRSGWSATLVLESEDLAVRWLGEEGPQRVNRFPYGLGRADVEAAILAGP